MMSLGWLLCGLGILSCVSGVYLFYRVAFEKNKSLVGATILMVMGIVLIALGTKIYLKV